MLAIAREALQRGHRVTVFCTTWQGEQEPNLALELVPSKGLQNATKMANFARDFTALIRQRDFDLVVGFNKWPGLDLYYAADSCFAYKARVERGFWYRKTARARCYLAFEQAVFGQASTTGILEVSPRERQRFIQCYQTPEERFYTLPPGISRDRVASQNWLERRRAGRQALAIGDNEKALLAVGSGFRTKGLDRSIEALARLSDVKSRLLVVGEDKQKPYLRLAKRLGVAGRVAFLGGRNDLPDLLQAADVLVHPAYRENTGNVLLEAMIAGLPVVASDVCGYAHYVADAGMGEVVASPFAVDAFVASIRRVLAKSADSWHCGGAQFASQAEIYHRPQVAVNIIETRASVR